MKCSIDGCPNERKYAKTGWCQTHYHRWWRTGSPYQVKQERGAAGPGNANWKGDAISYRTAHTRLVRAKGKASDQDCAECGKPAQHWSYDGGDVPKWETFGTRTIPYSTDPDRYQPLCRGCHVKRDRVSGWPRQTQCAKGHEFTEENTYVRSDGERSCRACRRDSRRRKTAEMNARGLSSRGRLL